MWAKLFFKVFDCSPTKLKKNNLQIHAKQWLINGIFLMFNISDYFFVTFSFKAISGVKKYKPDNPQNLQMLKPCKSVFQVVIFFLHKSISIYPTWLGNII